MPTGATFDKSRLLPLYARINEAGEVIQLTFVDDAAAAFDISSLDFVLKVYKRPNSTSPQFTLTIGDGLSVTGTGSNKLNIALNASRATQSPNTYFYRLYSNDEDSTWLNGSFEFHNGEFDGVNSPDEITVTNSGTAVTITVSSDTTISAASQSEVNTGTDTAKYISPSTLQDRDDTSSALTDAASIAITGPKHTLSTSSSRTFTISHTGDCMIIDVTLSATSVTFTFPSGTLCIYAGTASGDNTMPISGATSGDHIMIGIVKVGSNYRATGINFGQ